MAIAEQITFEAVGRETARAWLGTTIPEAIQRLEFELFHLDRTEPGWSFDPSRSQYYFSLDRHLSVVAATNLTQMCELVHGLKSLVDEHDYAVFELIRRCLLVSDSIVESPAFGGILDSIREEIQSTSSRSWDSYFGAYTEDVDRLSVLAAHVINRSNLKNPNAGLAPLPEHFTIAPLWNAHRPRFMAILQDTQVSSNLDEMALQFTVLETKVNSLLNAFLVVRRGLSVKHDLPYATPPAAWPRPEHDG